MIADYLSPVSVGSDGGGPRRDNVLLPLRLMEALYNASPSPMVGAGTERNVFFWNAAATRLFGFTAAEAMSRSVTFLAAPEHAGDLHEVHERILCGETIAAREFTALGKTGERLDIRLGGAPLRGDAGAICGAVFTLEDVTGRHRVDSALRESEDRYRQLFEQIADGIVVHREGRILLANSACHRFLGLADGQLVGRHLFEFLHPDDHASAQQRIAALMAGKSLPETVEYRICRPDETVLEIEVNSAVFNWDGAPAIQFVAHDLTERRRTEHQLRTTEAQMRQAQKMEAVGRLAGGIAHDFNNVLTAIGGFSALLRDELKAGPEVTEYLFEIERGVQRASALTHQLLAFSKRQVMQAVVLDVNRVLRDLEPMLRRLLGEDILLRVTLAEQIAPVIADTSQLEQVIVNLAVNARDAMPNGGELTIETHKVMLDDDYAARHVHVAPGNYMLLAVSDTGIGMSPEVREKIFEPFFTTKATGTGLGLATVYGIVQQNGGSIWVYSEPGKGSSFKVYLPAHGEEFVQPVVPMAVHSRPTSAATVLLVEDDPAVRRLTERMLQRAGLSVLLAPSAPAALELARAHAGGIDVVLTDVIMPEMQGPDLLAALRHEFPRLRGVFMSGYAEDAIARRGGICADVPLVEKPFSAATLLTTLNRVLQAT